ncbi:nuclear transport factor 2 family protein [Microtetraspora fusca]|uniref:Nuclear transport factor 2 family protein n=1 Tax=Microtetraspora fusca TaxID=1997 RepID=A0ABW6V4H1_MICFU|nr:nuclear transport factor 2 family protein [Microtetraspora fusca]
MGEQEATARPDAADRLFEAINAHDQDAVTRCYTAEAVLVTPEIVAEGREQIASYYVHTWEGFPDVTLAVMGKAVCGDLIVVEALSAATHGGPYLALGGDVLQATGRRVRVRSCWLFTVEHDLIASQRLYYDQLQTFTQLGLTLCDSGEPLP